MFIRSGARVSYPFPSGQPQTCTLEQHSSQHTPIKIIGVLRNHKFERGLGDEEFGSERGRVNYTELMYEILKMLNKQTYLK